MSVLNFFQDYWLFLTFAAIIVLAYLVIVIIPLRRENRRKTFAQHCGELVLVMQASELETDFWARYERLRLQFIDARNGLALIQPPVLPYPFNTSFEFEWFGTTHTRSTVGLSFEAYLVSAVKFYAEFKEMWDVKITDRAGVEAMMRLTRKQQALPDDADIWAS